MLKLLKIITIIMLLIALRDNPYSYYQLLRWCVSGVSFYSVFSTNDKENTFWFWTMLIVGILFNPLIPFYFERETWAILDIITALIVLISITKD